MPYTSSDIRNVCLVGPSHAGKTLLAEALLHAGGATKTKGTITGRDTVSDFTDREREIGHSQFSSICYLDHGGIVERGSPGDLIQEGGRFSTLYKLQCSQENVHGQ